MHTEPFGSVWTNLEKRKKKDYYSERFGICFKEKTTICEDYFLETTLVRVARGKDEEWPEYVQRATHKALPQAMVHKIGLYFKDCASGNLPDMLLLLLTSAGAKDY